MYSKLCEGCGTKIADAQRPQRKWCSDRCRKRHARSTPFVRPQPAPARTPAVVVNEDDLDYAESQRRFMGAVLGEPVTRDAVAELLAEAEVWASAEDEAAVLAVLAGRVLVALDGVVSAADHDPDAACVLLAEAEPILRALLALADDLVDDRVLSHLALQAHNERNQP